MIKIVNFYWDQVNLSSLLLIFHHVTISYFITNITLINFQNNVYTIRVMFLSTLAKPALNRYHKLWNIYPLEKWQACYAETTCYEHWCNIYCVVLTYAQMLRLCSYRFLKMYILSFLTVNHGDYILIFYT